MFALIIGLVILLFIGIGLWLMTVKSQTPKRVIAGRTPDMPYEDIVITSQQGKLKGWFIAAKDKENTPSPLIIIVHGWGSSKARMLRYLNPLYEAGYALLLFDVRSHGESEREKAPTAKTFRDDVIAVLQYAKSRQGIDPDRIGILAHSFGGFGSIIANKNSIGIQALVTDSMPSRFRTIMEAALKEYKLPYFPLGPILSKLMFMRAGISRKELASFDIRQALDQQHSPVLLIHSKLDNYVPPTELAYLVENNKFDQDKIQYLYVESHGHRSSETDPKFWKHVLPFFERYV